MEKLIYLDNAATTKTRPEVVEAMLPYFTDRRSKPFSCNHIRNRFCIAGCMENCS